KQDGACSRPAESAAMGRRLSPFSGCTHRAPSEVEVGHVLRPRALVRRPRLGRAVGRAPFPGPAPPGRNLTPPPPAGGGRCVALPQVPGGPLTVVDPSCGDGAFLAAAMAALPRARAFGLELDPRHAATARRRVPRAAILSADALRGGWDALLARLPAAGTELWLGNPPSNGTSPLPRDAPPSPPPPPRPRPA